VVASAELKSAKVLSTMLQVWAPHASGAHDAHERKVQTPDEVDHPLKPG